MTPSDHDLRTAEKIVEIVREESQRRDAVTKEPGGAYDSDWAISGVLDDLYVRVSNILDDAKQENASE